MWNWRKCWIHNLNYGNVFKINDQLKLKVTATITFKTLRFDLIIKICCCVNYNIYTDLGIKYLEKLFAVVWWGHVVEKNVTPKINSPFVQENTDMSCFCQLRAELDTDVTNEAVCFPLWSHCYGHVCLFCLYCTSLNECLPAAQKRLYVMDSDYTSGDAGGRHGKHGATGAGDRCRWKRRHFPAAAVD